MINEFCQFKHIMVRHFLFISDTFTSKPLALQRCVDDLYLAFFSNNDMLLCVAFVNDIGDGRSIKHRTVNRYTGNDYMDIQQIIIFETRMHQLPL